MTGGDVIGDRGKRLATLGVWVLAALPPALGAQGTGDLSLAMTLTDAGGEPFGQVTDVEILPDGRFAVLDGQAKVIYLFAADGAVEARLGGEGQGPREIGGAQHMVLTPDNELVVMDFSNLRLNRWSSTGEHLGTTAIRDLVPTGYFPLGMEVGNDGVYLKSTGFRPGEGLALNRLTGSGQSEVVFEWQDGEPSCTYCPWQPTSGGIAMARGDTLYQIVRVRPGADAPVVWQRRDLPANERPRDEVDRMNQMAGQRQAREGGGGDVDDERFRWLPRFSNASGALAMDANGDLWAVPTVPTGENGIIDIFSDSGQLRSTLRLPHPVFGVALGPGLVAVRSESAIGEPSVMIYRRR